MPEVRIIREDDIPDIPQFVVDEARIKREARRKAKEEAEKSKHHAELRKPQAEVRLFSMDIHMQHYYGIYVVIPSFAMQEFITATSKTYNQGIHDTELLVVQFKDRTLAFDLQDGRELT